MALERSPVSRVECPVFQRSGTLDSGHSTLDWSSVRAGGGDIPLVRPGHPFRKGHEITSRFQGWLGREWSVQLSRAFLAWGYG